MKLEKLTPEQEQKMKEVREQWLNYFFSCKNSVNREAANLGIEWIYKLAGYEKPIIIYVDSPLSCQYVVAYLKEFIKQGLLSNKIAQVGAQVRDQVGDQVMAQVMAQVGDQVWDQVGDQVRAQVRAQVGAQVGAQVRAQVRDQVRAQVRDQVGAQVGDQKLEWSDFSSYGSIYDYGWVSFFDFFQQIGIVTNDKFTNFKNLIQSGIYDMIQLNGFCIVSDLPKLIKRNASGRLHNTSGAAVEFKDGTKYYFINGRSIPSWIIENPETITKEKFIKENNSDFKGAMYEVLGQEKIMKLLGAKEVARKTNKCKKPVASSLKVNMKGEILSGGVTFEDAEEEYILYESKFKDQELGTLKWVQVECPSTNTKYLLGVPPETTDPLEAVAGTFGLTSKQYSLHQTT